MQIVFDLFNFNFTNVHFSCRFLCITNFHMSHVYFLGFFYFKNESFKMQKKMIITVVHLAEEKVVVIDAS